MVTFSPQPIPGEFCLMSVGYYSRQPTAATKSWVTQVTINFRHDKGETFLHVFMFLDLLQRFVSHLLSTKYAGITLPAKTTVW